MCSRVGSLHTNSLAALVSAPSDGALRWPATGMDTIRFHCGSEAMHGPTINAVPGDDRESQTLGGSLTFLRRFRGAVPHARDAATTEAWGDVESTGESSLLAELLGDSTSERTVPLPPAPSTLRAAAEPADPAVPSGAGDWADTGGSGTGGSDTGGSGTGGSDTGGSDMGWSDTGWATDASEPTERSRSTRDAGRVGTRGPADSNQRPRDLPFRAAVATIVAIVSLGAVGAVWALDVGGDRRPHRRVLRGFREADRPHWTDFRGGGRPSADVSGGHAEHGHLGHVGVGRPQ